jgi:hypothetical protein
MTTDKDRVLRNATAMIGEHYQDAVIILRGRRRSIVRIVGNKACALGLLRDAYERIFLDYESGPEDDDSGTTRPIQE